MDKEQAAKAAALALASILGTAACGAPSPGAEPPSAHHQVVNYNGLVDIAPGDEVNIYADTLRIPDNVTVRMGTRAGKPPDDAPALAHKNTTLHYPFIIQADSRQGMADGPDGSADWVCGKFPQDILGNEVNFLPYVVGCVYSGNATGISLDPSKVKPCVVQSTSGRNVQCQGGRVAGRVSEEEDRKPAPTPLQKSQPTLIPPPKSKAGRFGRGS